MPMPGSGIFLTRVRARRTLCREHFEVILGCDAFPDAIPGQFIQVLCRDPLNSASPPGADAAFLRRPFSIAGLRRAPGDVQIALIGRVVGPGTAWLDALEPGDAVSILGPLGCGYSMPERAQRSLLIAGGVGLPPIRWLAEILAAQGHKCECIYGAQSRDLIPLIMPAEPANTPQMSLCAGEFAEIGVPVAITTDDGSCGMRGRVTDCFSALLAHDRTEYQRVYACGPEPMLKSIAIICGRHGIACELAMERVMGCGMATCQSCVVKVKAPDAPDGWRYALCCTEGPVFDAAHVIWA